MYQDVWGSGPQRVLKKLTKAQQGWILDHLNRAREDPLIGKPLTRPLQGHRRLNIREGNDFRYRLIYRFDPVANELYVIELKPRKDAYKADNY